MSVRCIFIWFPLNMLRVLLLSSVSVLFHVSMQVNGQCTFPGCSIGPGSESDRSLGEELQRHDQRLTAIDQKLSSRFEGIENMFRSAIQQVKDNYLQFKENGYCSGASSVCDCADIRLSDSKSISGIYRINVQHSGRRHYADVYCDMTTAEKGWTVFQRRKNNETDFYRGWSDYATGFGDSNGGHWLGNDLLHILTSKRKYKLRVELEDFDKQKRYAEYSNFSISSSLHHYTLTVGDYTGDAGDSLSYHNGRMFSTLDADNDEYSPRDNYNTSTSCAERYKGGWWYKDCHKGGSNLNGRYLEGNYGPPKYTYEEGITWDTWHGTWYSMKTVEMKITPA